ncbi:MAG: hypothetical protein J7M29_05635 [Verrucomicrobia bacterium]|nr:hypothetical protein [Verrucomicrobiota bacterium]
MRAVEPGRYKARRATVDDLPALRGLWTTALLPATRLEKEVGRFFVVERPDGVLSGAAAVAQSGWHGLLHNEAFSSEAEAREARPALWAGILQAVRSQGVLRLWIAKPAAPFWEREAGFREPLPRELARMPSEFREGRKEWLTLPIQDDVKLEEALRDKLEAFHAEEQRERERWERWSRFWMLAAWLVAAGFLAAAVWLLWRMVGGG